MLFDNLPPHTAAAAVKAVHSIKEDHERRVRAQEQAARTREEQQQREAYRSALAQQQLDAAKWARRTHNAQLFASLLQSGMGILNAGNGAFNGADGSFSAGFGFDPTAFWAPIQAAASMPIN